MDDCTKDPEGPLRFRESGRHRFRPFRTWNVRTPRPLASKLAANTPLLTRQHVLDALFPSVRSLWRTRKQNGRSSDGFPSIYVFLLLFVGECYKSRYRNATNHLWRPHQNSKVIYEGA